VKKRGTRLELASGADWLGGKKESMSIFLIPFVNENTRAWGSWGGSVRRSRVNICLRGRKKSVSISRGKPSSLEAALEKGNEESVQKT